MTYAQKSDLIERFGELELVQLTDRTHKPQSTVDDVPVDRALGDASALIDGYLGKVYALPLAGVPANLVKMSADIARYYLHGKAADKDSPVTRAFGEAVAWLKDVAAGRVQLEDSGVAPPVAPGAAGRVQASRPTFTRDTLRGF
ncbi:DUF1320 domain-containing protein [Methylobacterium sp. WL6]|uniref:gp436 family protein n=1 Tax=Methylobacterium sp. WL6 TaxID=2603901 RepID=UPI0011CB0300|nr:DUF1320 domain-containing protein [Methylobacterium sp. WL6]TXN60893.1 DUF1320 domain-containing protein [Methylobacterium sp. WL6]